MLWIALYLPQLPLDLAYRRWPETLRDSLQHTMPLAIVESRRIGWANPCAQDAGVLPGMAESSAYSRVADIMLLARDPAAEEKAIVEAALWALHFTPQASLLPDGLLMDVTASLRLFGGHVVLMDRLREGLLELGLTPQLSAAPTATAAWLFAQHADARESSIPLDDSAACTALLDGLPVRLMASTQPHLETLQTIGCQDIGQLRRLPRGGLARRFGKDVLAELDRAFGMEPEAHEWYEPPATFCARLELPARVDTTEPLLFAARRLLMQMTGWLVARHGAVVSFTLNLHHDTHRNRASTITPVKIVMGSASRDLAHLTLLLQEHLAKIVLDISVIELSLQANEIVALAAPNTELFPAPVSQAESTGRLIERLSSRLGEAAIRRLAIVGDHRPERCSASIAASAAIAMRKKQLVISGDVFAARPAWLLAQPLPLMIRHHKPFYQGVLTLLAGPERIEAGWWDDALEARDYFIARNDGHLLLWIYRERQGANVVDAGWFLHGLFG